jgi:hypothetical protein
MWIECLKWAGWAVTVTLPGWLCLRAFGMQRAWLLAFPLSCTFIYLAVLVSWWVGGHFDLVSVLGILAAVCGIAWWRTPKVHSLLAIAPTTTWPSWLWVAVASAVMAWRCWIQPFTGADAIFRWHLLPQLMFWKGSLDFYPPVSLADFQWYLYADGIPPLIACQVWWLYAWLGHIDPSAVTVLMTTLFASVLLLAATCADREGRHPGGTATVVVLLACAWLFWDVAMGQEAGWIMLGLAATACAWSCAARCPHGAWPVIAALALQPAMQAREYGAAFIAMGMLMGWHYRTSWKSLVVFALTAFLAGLPWWTFVALKTGNPFYALSPGGWLPVNPVLQGYLDHCHGILGWHQRNLHDVASILWFLFRGMAPVVIMLVLTLCWRSTRSVPLLVAVGLALVLWAQSIAFASGGHIYAAKVAAPLFVLGAMAVPLLLTKIPSFPNTLLVGTALAIPMVTSSLLIGFTAPQGPGTLGWRKWMDTLHTAQATPVLQQLPTLPPRDGYVLSDNAYAHAEHLFHGGGPLPIPPWARELHFLTTGHMTIEAARQELKRLGVKNDGELLQSVDQAHWSRFPLIRETVEP